MAGEKYLIELAAGNLPADSAFADLSVRVHRDDAGTFANLPALAVGSRDMLRADEFHTDTVTDVPDAFVDADWSVATGASTGGQLDVTIASLPAANGAAISDVEYELDASGTWTSSGGTASFTITGLTASTSYDVRLRAVNSNGNAAAGNTETATSSAAAASATIPASVGSSTTNTGSNTATVTHPGVGLGADVPDRQLYIVHSGLRVAGSSDPVPLTLTLEGGSCTLLAQEQDTTDIGFIHIYEVDVDPGGTSGEIVGTMPGGNVYSDGRSTVEVLRGVKAGGWTASALAVSDADTQSISLGGNVTNGDIIIATALSTHGSALTQTWTGVTDIGAEPIWSGANGAAYVGVHEATATESPRTITSDVGLVPDFRHIGVSIKLS